MAPPQMRQLVAEWNVSTGHVGEWEQTVVPITLEVTVAAPFWSEFVGGSAIALEYAPAGQVLPSSGVLLCAMVALDGSWVLRAFRSSVFAAAV